MMTGAIFALLFLVLPAPAAAEFDHSVWDELLQRNVRAIDGGKATQVDYAGMAQAANLLDNYLEVTASVDRLTFDNWDHAEQLAFLINVYNAATVSLILSEYPDLESIRDLGSILRSPWRRPFVLLFGENLSLDNIEHDMIRGWKLYNEPRIHFAVNCAAIGCPPLRTEAYVGALLQKQLDENTRLFLSDRTRNYVSGNRLYISQIFNWYEEDFSQGWQGYNSVAEFLVQYGDALELTAEQQVSLQAGDLSIRYLRYDWDLNRAP